MKFICYLVYAPALLLLSLPVSTVAQTLQTNSLADVSGFESVEDYPLGDLQPVQDGPAKWQPASPSPGQIINLGGAHGNVLRRTQTGVDNIDMLSFPPVDNGVLRVEFDARASTNGARTLDVFLLPPSDSASEMASMLGWGTVSNKVSCYNGSAWVPVINLDTNWHRFEMISYLSGSNFNTFDLNVDGARVGTGLPWRYTFPAGTAFNRLRIGGIRGPAGQYADVDNLVITAEVTTSVPETIILTNPVASTGSFSFSFLTRTAAEYMVESVAALPAAEWNPVATLLGNGLTAAIPSQPATGAQQFFRVSKLPPAGWSDGYRGIWFTLGQFSTYGDKYSGGLGTYTANHVPIAIYAPAVNKTFFVYGGTIKDQQHLLIMASYYDHATGKVPRPTIVHDKQGVTDPHDNGSLCLDADGYVWVFVSGRATARPGFKYRSKRPYSVSEFQFVQQAELTYPQPWFIQGKGFLHLFTKYSNGRELYWETSTNGFNWSAHQKLAGIGGHYQVSQARGNKIGTFFNRHPGGNVDKRTDLYYAQTTNMGSTWTTVTGSPLTLPLTTTNNPALVIDYASQGRLMYTCDLNFDTNDNPVMLYVTSAGPLPGPQNDPRFWTITRWTGTNWTTSTVCQSDHNYDMGSLYIRPDRWIIIGPTQNGPQLWQAGGEMALWQSYNLGQTWTMIRQITTNSVNNHTYARRPLNATDPFFAYWADGNPTNLTPSKLYFGNSDGTQVFQLPYDMTGPTAIPQQVEF